MKIVEINSVLYGSTGKIARQIARVARERGMDVIVCVPKGRHNNNSDEGVYLFGNRLSEDLHLILSRLTGLNGFFSLIATLQLVKKIQRINPDVIHMHNLHNSYINLPCFFHFLKKFNGKVIWTLHDCWTFTGHCPHFTFVSCDKWKKGCVNCPQYRNYPQSFIDTSKLLWKKKKSWFTGIKKLTIVTPSEWLAGLVKESFLKEYPVKVINNGIDLKMFYKKYTDFRDRYDISPDTAIVLGVAFGWGERKGLDVFIRLAQELNDNYKIVLVGTDERVDKVISRNIVSIHRTNNQQELAEIYAAANVFVNPTREDTFPTTNLEALACGVPVITFNTGGSPEAIDNNSGITISCDDFDALKSAIIKTCEKKVFVAEDCCRRAEKFDMNNKFAEYVDLYEEV